MSTFPEVDWFLKQQGTSVTNLPLYRLTWSGSAFEWRRGIFNDYYGSIFLREYKGVRYVPKYPYIDSKWILEKYFPPFHEDALPESNLGSYEPLFVFQDKNEKALPVVLKIVELLVGYDRNRDKPSLDTSLFDKLEKQEFNEILDSIDSTPIASLLHTKEAIVVP